MTEKARKEKRRVQHAADLPAFLDAETRDDLQQVWPKHYPPATPVVEFYGHKKSSRFQCFSNFYQHADIPFTVPDCCWNRFIAESNCEEDSLPPRTVMVTFSEKSIMLCKAAVMGDREAYAKIILCDTPGMTKKIGRSVTPFDEGVWQSVILEVAFEVVYQKFRELGHGEYEVLLKTKDALIVEASPTDAIWGVGKPTGHCDCQDPRQWGRGNVLGWALMKARSALRSEQKQNGTSS